MEILDTSKENIECDKIAYPTLKDAQKSIRHNSKANGHSFTAYKCNECGNFHLASARQKRMPKHQNQKKSRPFQEIEMPTGKKTKAGNPQTKKIIVKIKY